MRPHALLLLVIIGVLLSPPHVDAQVVFDETFSGPASGWTTDPEWQIGATAVGPPPAEGTWPDPAADHSPGADNRVAGTILGGNVATTKHDFRWLTSPAIDVADLPNGLQLRFWRWLNIDNNPFMSARVEAFDGSNWILLWENSRANPVTDDAWVPVTLDLTPYKNTALRVRFGFAVAQGGGFPFSGWNVDDIQIEQTTCTDADHDGHASVSCGGDDCDDTNPTVYPGAVEVCDGVDNNCNDLTDETAYTYYRDLDGDGFGDPSHELFTCPQPMGYVPVAGDCNDSDPLIHPGAPELCDGIDNNCRFGIDDELSGPFYRDADHDGYGDPRIFTFECSKPDGYVSDGSDCDDSRADVHPGAIEYCDQVDNNCDGRVDENCMLIESIRDVANDNGGSVRLTWIRAADDTAAVNLPVVRYSVWRRIDAGAAGPPNASLSSSAEAPGTWEQIATVPANRQPRYQLVVATLCDSTAAGRCWTVLRVRAHKYPVNNYVDAPIDSGYSVDNLGWVGVGDPVATHTGLHAIAPNPASQGTRIRFDLATDGEVRLEVLDLAGRIVRRVVSGSRLAGRHEIGWDGRNDRGNGVPAGMYVIRLSAGGIRDTRRVVITR